MELTSKHIRWCWSNGIYISPTAIDTAGRLVKIELTKNNVSRVGKEVFHQKTAKDKENLYKRIDMLYLEIFKKNNN